MTAEMTGRITWTRVTKRTPLGLREMMRAETLDAIERIEERF